MHHPENTLAAFAAARDLGVVMQEFDVQTTRDGVLVCMHDESLDRTTDACQRLGPGALLAHATWAEVQRLDAGSWFDQQHAGERVPTLATALATMLPRCVPLIEHKTGTEVAYLDALRSAGAMQACIVQSFDWQFVTTVRSLCPDLAVAVLGPTDRFRTPSSEALAIAKQSGAGMVHWQANALTRRDVERIHAADMLVCTYTTDDELGWAGGKALGFDAMCTNDPAAALRSGGGSS